MSGSGWPITHEVSTDVAAQSLVSANSDIKIYETGSLALAGAMTLGGTLTFQNGGTLSVGDHLTIGRSGILTSQRGFYEGKPPAIVHGAVDNAGQILVDSGGLVLDGTVTGSGFIRTLFGATLEFTGGVSQSIYANDGAALTFDHGAVATGPVFVSGHVSLDLKDSAAFGGTLVFRDPTAKLDIVGAISATLDGRAIHVADAAGHTYDLDALFAAGTPAGTNGVPTAQNPDFSLVSSGDGHGGTVVSFQSTIEHAPVADGVAFSVLGVPTFSVPTSGSINRLDGFDQDYDTVTPATIKAAGSSAAATPIDTTSSWTQVEGRFGTLSVFTNRGELSYSYRDGSADGAPLGSHPVDEFVYTVGDGRGGVGTASVKVSIDRLPVAVGDTATSTMSGVTVNAAQGVLANDSDPDGDALIVKGLLIDGYQFMSAGQTIGLSHGQLTLQYDGSYSYVSTMETYGIYHETVTYVLGLANAPNPYANFDPNAPDLRTAVLDIAVIGDTTPPTLAIALSDRDLTAGETAKVSFQFSEAVASFSLDDVSIGHGQLSNLTTGDGMLYTATLTPEAGYAGFDALSVAAGSYADLAGNPGGGADASLVVRTAPSVGGTSGNDILKGTAGNDVLFGFAGNDQLDGKAGADRMFGGLGDDTYAVDNANDVVIENPGEGTDSVNATISYTLSSNVENLQLSGTSAVSGTGNDLANTINGNDAANVILGLDGADTLRGNGGADTIDGGAGNDYISAGAGADVLIGGSGTDTIYGGADADTFVFKSLADFGPASAMDLIGDFSSAQGDTIDLSAIPGLIWLGTSAFMGHAGELHYAKGAGGTLLVSADLNGDKAADFQLSVAGQTILSATDIKFAADTTPPTLSISPSQPNLNVGEAAVVTFAFSEAVSGFTLSDIAANHGQVTGFTAVDTKTYSAVFTPEAGYTGAGGLSVAASSYTDVAGNLGGPGQTGFAIDTLAPSVSMSLSDANLTPGKSATVTISFSEAVSGFSLSDLVSSHGSLTNFMAIDPSSYSVLYTPDPNYSGPDSVSVVSASYADLAGNAGSAGGIALSSIMDNVAPTVSVSINDGDLILGETATVSFAFSEAVSGFALTDISAGHGQLTNLIASDASHYTAVFTPGNNYAGTDSLSVMAGSYTDTAGNLGGAGHVDVSINTVAGFGGITFTGGSTGDVLKGLATNDTLYGLAGNDQLDGKAGADRMFGGLGDDTYAVDNANDVVIENPGEGTDSVNATISYTLSSNVENLQLSGTSAVSGTGNDLANTINGNDAANVILGLDGADTLRGNGGADTIDGGAGNDYISAGAGADVLIGGSGTDTIYGGADADTFVFKSLADFGPASAMDLIGDFSSAQGDTIDLSAIPGLIWLGTSAFMGHAGELHYAKGAGGTLLVSADLNGDKAADFQLSVAGQTTLSLSDFHI